MGRSGQTNRKAPPPRVGATVQNDRVLREFYVDELEHTALGTADLPMNLLQRLVVAFEGVRDVESELEESDIEDLLLDRNVEVCPSCGWWTYSHEIILDEETEEPVGCHDCMDDPADDE